jgi:hypothetical protein
MTAGLVGRRAELVVGKRICILVRWPLAYLLPDEVIAYVLAEGLQVQTPWSKG